NGFDSNVDWRSLFSYFIGSGPFVVKFPAEIGWYGAFSVQEDFVTNFVVDVAVTLVVILGIPSLRFGNVEMSKISGFGELLQTHLDLVMAGRIWDLAALRQDGVNRHRRFSAVHEHKW